MAKKAPVQTRLEFLPLIQRITIRAESLEIEVNVQELCAALSQAPGIQINSPKDTAFIVGAYNIDQCRPLS